MDPITLALILGAAGVAKSELLDRPAAGRKRKLEATKTRYSPWTGMVGGDVEDPDSLNSGMNWGFQGAALGQAMGQSDLTKAMQAKQGELLDSQIGMNNSMASQYSAPSLYGAVPRKMASKPGPWDLGNDYSF